MDLEQLRRQIDAVDEKILNLLNERAGLISGVAKAKEGKESVYVPAREKEVIDKLIENNRGAFPKSALKAVYSEIISACRLLEKPLKVAYLGPETTFTHIATLRKFGSGAELVAKESIADVFRAVAEKEADLGVVPIENSIEGAVNSTLDTFQDFDLDIIAEVYLNISHHLLSNAGIGQIAKIYSHPQAFAQCRPWILKNIPRAELIDVSSTAKAAELAAKEKNSAAIASRLAAEKYGLQAITENIETDPYNRTRFLVLGSGIAPKKTGRDKTSIMLSVKHHAGALYKTLAPLYRNKINMTLIESRPTKHKAWPFVFFLDVQGYCHDANIEKALKSMEKHCTFIKVIGCYPEEQNGG